MGDFNLRLLWRVTKAPWKIRRYDRVMEALEKAVTFHDVLETKGVGS
jgi:hypothetical protein